MPGSTVLKFTDPYEYQAVIGRSGSNFNTILRAAGSYQSDLMLVDLGHVGVQQGRLSLPRITQAAPQAGHCMIIFPTSDAPVSTIFNGIETTRHDLTYCSPGTEYVANTSAGCWGGLTFPPRILASASQALIGFEIAASKVAQVIHTLPSMMSRLHNLYDAMAQIAATVPDILAHPEVSRAIEQQLLRTVVACIADNERIRKPNRHRQGIIQRFHRVLEENQDAPLYLTEICATIGATERTLNFVCRDYLGMSPHQYLLLRRMNLARQALTLADPVSTTVTSIANDYGFAELGRFGVRYRALFGEPPSATLRRAVDQRV